MINQNLSILTLPELLFISNLKTEKKILLKLIFFDLLNKGSLTLRKFEIKNRKDENANFIFNSQELPLKIYELELLSIFDNRNLISLKEFLLKLSNYANPLFYKKYTKYRLDILFFKSLEHESIITVTKKNKLIFKRQSYSLNSKGVFLQNSIKKLNIFKMESDVRYQWLVDFYKNIYNIAFKINNDYFQELNYEFDQEFSDALTRDFMAIKNFCNSYPEPNIK